MPHDWDAATYDRLPIPMTGWGARCWTACACAGTNGPGRRMRDGSGDGDCATASHADTVIALDGSASMIGGACAPRGGAGHVPVADLAAPLPLDPSTPSCRQPPSMGRRSRSRCSRISPRCFGRRAARRAMRRGREHRVDRGCAGALATLAASISPRPSDPRPMEAAGFTDVSCGSTTSRLHWRRTISSRTSRRSASGELRAGHRASACSCTRSPSAARRSTTCASTSARAEA